MPEGARPPPASPAQHHLMTVLDRVEAAPSVQIQTGQVPSRTALPMLPDATSHKDGDDVMRPDSRVRDGGA